MIWECEAIYDWLAANGVSEWLPENPRIAVADGAIVFSAFAWVGPAGWNLANIHPTFDEVIRTVPLRCPPTSDVAGWLAELDMFATLHGRAALP